MFDSVHRESATSEGKIAFSASEVHLSDKLFSLILVPLPFLLSRSRSLDRAAMADYHFVYKDVEGATTQWDDIQRRLGNLPEKPPAFKPPEFVPRVDADEQPKSKEWLDEREADELEELEDDLEDDRFLEQYRYAAPSLPPTSI